MNVSPFLESMVLSLQTVLLLLPQYIVNDTDLRLYLIVAIGGQCVVRVREVNFILFIIRLHL